MGCPHCLSDCTTDGKHITLEQLKRNLDFAYDLIGYSTMQCIVFSGGEPFEHPQIKQVLETIAEYQKRFPRVGVVIATNGYQLAHDKDLYNWYRDFVKNRAKNFLTQVTAVKEYYPKRLIEKDLYWLSKIKNCSVVDEVSEIYLYPQGRALNLKDARWETKAPKCVNLRLIANQIPETSFRHIVNTMPVGKYCTPRINIDGSIALGESRLCPPIGTIDNDLQKLGENVKHCKCGQCSIPLEILRKHSPQAYSLIH
nr:4Fe-4S cluster-binding domain-containing protein [Selenomonas ruminantium]